jgi:hypothetical protein
MRKQYESRADKLERFFSIEEATKKIAPRYFESSEKKPTEHSEEAYDMFTYQINGDPCNVRIKLEQHRVRVFMLDENNSPLRNRPDFGIVSLEVKRLYEFVQGKYNLGVDNRHRTEKRNKQKQEWLAKKKRKDRQRIRRESRAERLRLVDTTLGIR